MARPKLIPEGLYDPRPVTRVTEPGGSRIDPPFDPNWPAIEQLRWKAGVVEADSHVRVQIFVSHANQTEYGGQLYGYVMPGSGGGNMTVTEMWNWLNGVMSGAQARNRTHRDARGEVCPECEASEWSCECGTVISAYDLIPRGGR